jgi:XTP/dITP diphosphohydrolase
MALKLFLASGNAGKLRDFRAAAGTNTDEVVVLPLPGLQGIAAPEETGSTFEENACLKAEYYSHFAPGELVMADDSGLEVDALDGAPGVRSARYAADAGVVDLPDANDNTDVWNNMVLLRRMSTVPLGQRQARYRCVLAAAVDGQTVELSSGSVEGTILTAPNGTGGFGYDPLFYLPELDRTMAEIDLETKFQLSHRGRAFRALLEKLR